MDVLRDNMRVKKKRK